ncbi:glycosyltransferase [Geomonas paludis]|nr:glycosyltransferase [Geomonas paludis]UPU37762.1 glycosyltransferase [Geomonas paludis]
MDISIVIPTYNNSKLLKRTLEHFVTQVRFPDAEVEMVVVNNNCQDDTDAVVKSYIGKLPLKLVAEGRQGISCAKNAGIREATGDLVIFTDDDVKPAVGWIESYWKAFRLGGARRFWGGSIVSDHEAGVPSREILQYAPPSVSGMNLGKCERCINPPEYFVGANWACPRRALNEAGVFNESLGLNPSVPSLVVGEETELMDRLRSVGYVGWYLPDATLHHFVPAAKVSLKHIADRREGLGFYNFIGKKAPRWAYRSFLENGLKTVAYKVLGMSCVREYILFKEAKGVLRACYFKG